MKRHPPLRECEGGCGKRRPSWREWTCFACAERDRQLNRGESLRDFRRRLAAGPGPTPDMVSERPLAGGRGEV